MTSRLALLIFGPVVLVAASYWLAIGSGAVSASAGSHREPFPSAGLYSPDQIEAACHERAVGLLPLLAPGCRAIVRPPFVLAGDLTESELEAHYEHTILPTMRALNACFFDRLPEAPIAVLLFASERSYREHAMRLDRRETTSYYGYYQKPERRIVLNIATGNGTLAHELTHALAHADFPDMPEWFDEGLASLYEQSEFSDDGLRLIGVSNWRLNYLYQAARQGRLPDLQSMMTAPHVRPEHEAVDYALARYFCLYLQDRDLLQDFYRKYRANIKRDPAGMHTLLRVTGAEDFAEVEADFRNWLVGLMRLQLSAAAPRSPARDAAAH